MRWDKLERLHYESKALDAVPKNLSSIPGTNTVEGENFQKLFSDLHVCMVLVQLSLFMANKMAQCTYRTQLTHSIMVQKKKKKPATETHIYSPSTYLEDRTEVGHLTFQANLGYRMRPSLKKVKD